MMQLNFETRMLPDVYDYLAPDRSEIRLLSQTTHGGICHARLPAGAVANAVHHQTVDELWYCLGGHGELWRHSDHQDEVVQLTAGMSATIPRGVTFQWRNAGADPLDVVIATIPPWPGPSEAVQVDGKWNVER